jgi:hypothetical protein
MAEYLKRDIARILKKRPGTIEYYTACGLVIPDIEPSQGKGKPRVYSGRNLIEFGMIEAMSKVGTSLATVERVLSILREGKWVQSEDFADVVTKKPIGEALEWIKKETVSFDSFWTSEDWGLTRELVFMDLNGFTPSGEVAYGERVQVIEKKSKSSQGFSVDPVCETNISVATILWLGSIKKAAVKMVLG